ncbi:prepilin-type N-terminal cleavage/methylation domain-containing protein [Candidatus Parcubacteria bacterium]|jgi:uncharacterized protein (TIGR02145 family)/prepilin-type N-terminal cleavage/methylation domain-containing protein|nr:prepilin-type N-terminal cleavage/methylation domain-containing protein [Candidatus Parcubacteria bacterium]MBT7228894.1 prepilin-type N-terminal cleavage/methylation domain-containing protein [Candidatus Parcubacteria bacterium]
MGIRNFKIKQDGFNLIEILVVIAIFVILISSATSLVTRRITDADLDAKTQEIMGLIDKARNYSASGFKGDVWGIKVLDSHADCTSSADCVIMYKGVYYSTRDNSFDQEVSLGTGKTGTYLESTQINEFHFSAGSGWLSTSTISTSTEQLIVVKNNTGDQRSVVINPTGVSSLFYCGEDKVFDIDGNSYRTVKIGDQCWMTQNLNTGTMLASAATDPTDNGAIEKWCENDVTSGCDAKGGLYHWDELMGYVETASVQGICPAGWHIPTNTEVNTLEANFPPASDGTELKKNGSSGFDLIESNEMNTGTNTYDDADLMVVWTSTIHDDPATESYAHYTDTPTATMGVTTNDQGWGFSVRCLKDY